MKLKTLLEADIPKPLDKPRELDADEEIDDLVHFLSKEVKPQEVVSHVTHSWGEIIGDYIAQHGMWDEAGKELVRLFTAVKRVNIDLNALNKKMEDFVRGGEGWTMDELAFTNKIAKKTLGRPMVNIKRLAASLGDDDDDGFEW